MRRWLRACGGRAGSSRSPTGPASSASPAAAGHSTWPPSGKGQTSCWRQRRRRHVPTASSPTSARTWPHWRRTAARLRSRVLEPLAASEHEELLRTLRAFVAHHYDRAATSEALHVHRNTLAYRLRRIERLTGLDLASARDLACVYLALGISAGEVAPPSPDS